MPYSITMTKGPDRFHAMCRNWREVRKTSREWKVLGYTITGVRRVRRLGSGAWFGKGWHRIAARWDRIEATRRRIHAVCHGISIIR